IPTKTMVASAKLFHDIKRAAMFGINVGPPEVDYAGFMARKQSVIDEIEAPYVRDVFQKETGIDVLVGDARFESAHELRVGEHLVEADKFVIAAGSSPTRPDALKPAGALTNIDLLNLTELPKSMTVVDGGPI